MRQTAKIRRAVSKWLTATDLMAIRQRMPQGMPEVQPDMSKEEKRAVLDKRQQMMTEQSQKNLEAILDALLDLHPDETIELVGLCCFIEPEELDNYKTTDLLGAIMEMLGDENVINFFTLFMRLGTNNISTASGT